MYLGGSAFCWIDIICLPEQAWLPLLQSTIDPLNFFRVIYYWVCFMASSEHGTGALSTLLESISPG